jgi:hypothetical protein
LLVACLVAAAGCGAGEPLDGGSPDGQRPDDGPRVADDRFDGEFAITDVVVDGVARPPVQRPSLAIEARFGGLTVNPGCNTYLGSFTLTEDGRASFTVTGGSDLDCGDLTAQEEAVLSALDGATDWAEIDGGFRFDGPATSLTVAGPTA